MKTSTILMVLAAALAMRPAATFGAEFTSNTLIDAGNMAFDGQEIVVRNCTLTVNGTHSFTSLQVLENGVITHSAAPSGQAENRLILTISQDVLVDATSGIGGAGLGFLAGPGAGGATGYDGAGGGYGGVGCASGTAGAGGLPYGSITAPTDLGSGGGGASYYGASNGAAGGGVIHLTVAGTLTVNGTVSANGGSSDYRVGAGSGGSIFVTAGTLAGSGSITANGGNATGSFGSAAGSGGRIALYYGNTSFGGTVSAYGGALGGETPTYWGGAGTIFTKATAAGFGLLLIDNNDHLTNAWTRLKNADFNPVASFNMDVKRGARVYQETPVTLGSLHLFANSVISHNPQQTNFHVTASGDVTIDPGGVVTADGMGQVGGPGAGVTTGYDGGGGGYGGVGCASGTAGAGGLPYGSITAPTDLGSGGGGAAYYGASNGAAGGGALRFTVAGTLTVNGTVSANGGSSDYRVGAGSGGSIFVTTGTLAGSGSITANGGNATGSYGSAAGGGGRIALYSTDQTFSGTVSAYGGALGGETPTYWGGAGTIFTKTTASGFGLLLIDNNDHLTNAWTRLKETDFNPVASFNMDVKRGARLYLETPLSLGNLHLFANSAISHNPQQTNFHVTASGDFMIDSGGVVTADGMGYVIGPGAGATTVYDGAGGGYGGVGAISGTAGGVGGMPYGSITAPTDPGSGGGGASWYGMSSGAAGGGALRFTVAGVLTVDGTVRAKGGDSDYRAGAGSGGSIYLTAGTLAGSGSIMANGGDATGAYGSAAGGGGRIALHSTTDHFSGTASAYGGAIGAPSPTRWGGAGTIYRKAATSSIGTTIIDNGISTNSGLTRLASSFWPAGVYFDLIINHGAVVYPQDPLTFGNVSVTGASRISHDALQSGFHWVALGDFLLSGDSIITADGKGYGSLSGPGAGISGAYAGGGGGYGGRGGWVAETYNSYGVGGVTYGSSTAPVDLGSGGGGGAWYGNVGQAGGGALRLTVGGTLTIDGSVLANGLSSGGRDGAGSGGSIYLTAQSLAGQGLIAANGGDGNATWGGGAGGGGRIAIYSYSSPFAGTVSANGGIAYPGSPGSIFLSTSVPLAVASITPSGTIGAAVDHFDVIFTTPIDGGTFMPADVAFTTPSGSVPASAVSPLRSDGLSFRVSVPLQTAAGAYSIAVGPLITNIYGQSMSEPAVGGVTIQEPVIAGFVRDTNNAALPGVTVEITGGLRSTSTDGNGAFSLVVPPSFSGNLTASKAGWVFVPGVMPFTNVTANLTNQDFIAVAGTIAPTITMVAEGANRTCSWYGIRGVRYQPQSSTDLVNWLPFGAPITGNNTGASFTFQITADARKFYRVMAEN